MSDVWDADSPIEESYEPVALDADLVADLKAAIVGIPDLHEAYLVTRRVLWGGREKIGLGLVVNAGRRWRARRQIASLSDALRPFIEPPAAARLQWTSLRNTPVPDEVRAVGYRVR